MTLSSGRNIFLMNSPIVDRERCFSEIGLFSRKPHKGGLGFPTKCNHNEEKPHHSGLIYVLDYLTDFVRLWVTGWSFPEAPGFHFYGSKGTSAFTVKAWNYAW